MADAKKTFTFVCGQDDFLVGRIGRRRYEELSAEVQDDFSKEVISGFAGNVDEVGACVSRFAESVQTVPMFGGRRVVWLKDVSFLSDTVTGRAETTLGHVEHLQSVLQGVVPAETAVLITASPVDRRRSFIKWCEKSADFELAESGEGDALEAMAVSEAAAVGVRFGEGALPLLLSRVGNNTRLLVEEIGKLSVNATDGVIPETDVADLTPNAAQGEFFESAEAFFSGKLDWTLAALRRHFFAGGDARPILAALQNRNRILIQVRALADSGEARVGPRGIDGLQRAGSERAPLFKDAASEKSSYNVFTQNPWYLGKLAGGSPIPTLRRLIDNQRAFIDAFEEIIRRPQEQEEVLRDMSVRCLSA